MYKKFSLCNFKLHDLIGLQYQVLIQRNGLAANQIVCFKRHGLQSVRTDGLRMFTEVAECQKRVVAHIADDVFVVGVEGNQPAAIKARIALADGDHMAQTLEDLTGSGRAVMALVVQLLIVPRTVCPAAVVALIAVL